MKKKQVIVDTEVYRNYFLVMFRGRDSGVVHCFEMFDGQPLDIDKVAKIMAQYTTVSFNGNGFDLPILALACTGASTAAIKDAADAIIVGGLKPWEFERQYQVKIPRTWDHIDLMEVAPGQGGLKQYGGRLHSRRMQDLPIDPDQLIAPDQRGDLRLYCANDLEVTGDLADFLAPQIELREQMGAQYGVDLRSKSDAQIAEAVIRSEVQKITGERVERPHVPAGTTFRYRVPEWMTYTSPTLQLLLNDVRQALFIVSPTGSVEMPSALNNRAVAVGSSVYRLGIGGLHSSEQCQAHISDDEFQIVDRDVTSYYPAIILAQRLSPKHMAEENAFLRVYRSIVERRVEAKRAGNKVVDSSLKIVINGSFGKFGSVYSCLYAPDLMIQVTVTGQLALLMLIERLEAHGISVVSGNTDGIVIKVPRARADDVNSIVAWWERTTGFNTEETLYDGIFSRDVNNYLAIKPGGKAKGKGAFGEVSISKNPTNPIATEAVVTRLTLGKPVERTICECRDVRKFVTVRAVRGGGGQITHTRYDDTLTPGKKRDALIAAGMFQVVPGALTKAKFDWMPDGPGHDVEVAYRHLCGEDSFTYLGKVVRFYLGHDSIGPLYYHKKNKKLGRNKVADSDGAVPLMELFEGEFPSDMNHAAYIKEANQILADIGASEEKVNRLLYGNTVDLFVGQFA